MVVLLVSSDCEIAVTGNKVAKQASGGPIEFNQSTILGCGMSQLPHPEFKALLILASGLTSDLEVRLKEYDLSLSGFLALDAIERAEVANAYPMTRASLARLIGTTPASMSVLVGRLIRKKMVSEVRVDARTTGLAIKPPGQSNLAGGKAAWVDTFKGLSEVLSPSSRVGLLKAVDKLNLTREHERKEEHRAAYMRTLSKQSTKNAVAKHHQQSRVAESRRKAELE
jgi:DNA-binding MarR family transcriptional regulator